jgi:hypothetical protein
VCGSVEKAASVSMSARRSSASLRCSTSMPHDSARQSVTQRVRLSNAAVKSSSLVSSICRLETKGLVISRWSYTLTIEPFGPRSRAAVPRGEQVGDGLRDDTAPPRSSAARPNGNVEPAFESAPHRVVDERLRQADNAAP